MTEGKTAVSVCLRLTVKKIEIDKIELRFTQARGLVKIFIRCALLCIRAASPPKVSLDVKKQYHLLVDIRPPLMVLANSTLVM